MNKIDRFRARERGGGGREGERKRKNREREGWTREKRKREKERGREKQTTAQIHVHWQISYAFCIAHKIENYHKEILCIFSVSQNASHKCLAKNIRKCWLLFMAYDCDIVCI